MRIRLDDERLLADMLAFMRAEGCIAYSHAEGSIEVLRPARPGVETAEIKELLARWKHENPGASPEIVA
jgi:hypothetical protein